MKTRIVFCTGVLLLMIIMPFLPVRDEGGVYDSTLRLHVLANSDTTEDQTLKLLVRDAMVEEAARVTRGTENADEAREKCLRSLDAFQSRAEQVLRENGCDYSVSVELGEEYYPERSYGDIRLPSGRYGSLTVNIGESEGQNWWCVLFPPLCVEAAEAEEELVATGFTPNQVRLLTDSESPRYVIRFRILEWLEDIADIFA